MASGFKTTYPCSEGFGCAEVEREQKYYFVHSNGKLLDPGRYSRCWPFYSGIAQVKCSTTGKLGYINKSLELVVPCIYSGGSSVFRGEYAVVVKDGTKNVVNTRGEMILKDIKGLIMVTEDLALVQMDNTTGFIDLDGNVIIPFMWSHATPFENGLSIVGVNGKWGVINKVGELIIELKYNIISQFSEGYAYYSKSKKIGFLDLEGKEVIKASFDDAKKFSEGVAPVKVKKKWGYINKTGEYVIEPTFDDAYPYSQGFARVLKGNEWGFINNKGELMTYPGYSYIGDYLQGLITVQLTS